MWNGVREMKPLSYGEIMKIKGILNLFSKRVVFFFVLQCLNTLTFKTLILFFLFPYFENRHSYWRYRTIYWIIILKTDPSASTDANLDYFQFQFERSNIGPIYVSNRGFILSLGKSKVCNAKKKKAIIIAFIFEMHILDE